VTKPTAINEDGLARLKVLAVDDHAATRKLIGDVLRAAGIGEVQTAESGIEGLKTLVPFQPDLLIVDWNMPGMDGLTMTKIIRAAALNPDPMIPNPAAPIIMVTGQRREIDVERARLAGVSEFVIKPFSPSILVKRVQTTVTRMRGFVVTEHYVGPDRRRRDDAAYEGPRRRSADVDAFEAARRVMREELNALRNQGRGAADPETRRMAYQAMQSNISRARAIRDTAIEQASKSLVRYVEAIGGPERADPKVIDVHMDALGRLLMLGEGSKAAAVVNSRLRAAVDKKIGPLPG
jgi:CheY-like chemotaxis protein